MGPQRHEPLEFAAGDTLWFYRWFPEFQSAAGWSLSYNLFGCNGQYKTTFAASPVNDGFEVSVPSFGATLDPSIGYELAGYMSNTTLAPGTALKPLRHQVYSGKLKITPNLLTQNPQSSFQSYAYQQVTSLRATLLALNQSYLTETDVQRVKMVREKREAMRTELAFWEEKLHHEANQAAIRNGQNDPTLISPVFKFSF